MSVPEKVLIVEKSESIVTLILNRPNVSNALNPDLMQALISELDAISHDDNIRTVLLKGGGDNFCAGADVAWLKEARNYTEQQNLKDAQLLAKLMRTLTAINKTTICIIQGAAFGGAVGLVACCDIAIAHIDSKFCFSELKLGLTPAIISPYVISAIGSKAARRWILTAETFDSNEAERLGLVHKIFSTELELEKHIMRFVDLINATGPEAMEVTKQLLVAKPDYNSAATDIHTTQLLTQLRAGEEAQEGLKAFLEKRPPLWKN